MREILQTAPRVELEEAAQIIEACFRVAEEPKSYDDACVNKEWRYAMKEEIKMIEKNQTWLLVDRPEKKNIIGVKWIYRIKTDANGNPTKYKARLVARGFSQEYGVDYLETFAPVSRHDTIRAILALAAQMKWKLYQMDVKSAFLNGDLEEEIYVEQPPGFVRKGEEDKVFQLRKALYGLKQAPRAWYGRIDSYFLQCGFQRSMNDAALYVMKKDKDILIVSLYVDDLVITGNSSQLIKKFKEDMKMEFEMTDLGLLNYFLGMEIIQDDQGIFLLQEKYASKLVEKFGMKESKSVSSPLTPNDKKIENDEEYDEPSKFRSIVGGLLYLCASRPDLMFASSYLSRYMSAPLMKHYQEAKRVLRYVKGTSHFGVQFTSVENPELYGYSDSDWGGSNEDKKSTSGYVFTLGSAVFCWQSSKQQTVAQSTAEAEYIAVCAAANQAIWLQRLLSDIGFESQEGTSIYCDNKSAIAIGKNPVQHRRTKHIEIKYHFVREAEQKGLIQLKYCQGEVQLADLLTKSLNVSRFEELRKKLGVRSKLN
ncbi:Retrovirus-related Pol polyprotein from transposon RE2 [Cardamine amara subsp. amara]|uniref:Retrovirus-related Pol polyprotein from transposon RE2 n=1 Tax=Cardamine amara subsp. amara TaxID=228776 RepID=A0ABD1ACZ3_CARAN